MSRSALADVLGAPGADHARVAARVRRRPELLEAVLAGVGSDTARVKFGAGKVLRILSEQAPELVYPHFDFFARQLGHENSILRWNAMLVLANLACVDRARRIDKLVEAYLAPIPGPNLIDAANAIRGAAGIAVAKPYLADRIARRILEVESAVYATPECRNVAIGHAILALDRFFDAIAGQRAVREFVARQLDNTRRATRTKAQRFLKKRPAGGRDRHGQGHYDV